MKYSLWSGLMAAMIALAPGFASASEGVAAQPSPHNLTLQFQGTLWDGQPLDVSLVGVGPTFDYSWLPTRASNPTVVNLDGTIKEAPGGYAVSINLRQAIPILIPTADGQTSVQYQNITTQVSVLLKPGQTANLLENAGQKLSVTLKGVPVKAAAPSNLPVMGENGSLDENLQVSLRGTWFDGQSMDYSTLFADGLVSANLINPKFATPLPGMTMETISTIRLAFAPEPGGGYRVNSNLGASIPTLNYVATANPAGGMATPGFTYRNSAIISTVVVKNLDEPVQLLFGGGASITLTLSRPGKKPGATP